MASCGVQAAGVVDTETNSFRGLGVAHTSVHSRRLTKLADGKNGVGRGSEETAILGRPVRRRQKSSIAALLWSSTLSPPATARWVTVWLAILYLLL